MDDKVKHFQTWFLRHGGFFGEHVELHYRPLRGLHLRVSLESNLKPASCIVSCPHPLSLSSFNAGEHPDPFTNQFGHDAAGDPSPLSSLNLLRFFLIEQYQLGTQSFWWPYIHTLPDPSAGSPFDTPMYYDDDDKKWLQGTSLGHSTTMIDRTWRGEHAQGLRRLRHGNFDRYPWEIYKWAATVIASRSFPAGALTSSRRYNGTSEQDGSPVLLPGLDLLNHSPAARVTWQWTEDACNILSDQQLSIGTEVFNNYAPKSNEELMMGYGFSLFRNASDHCNLALGAMAVGNIKDVLGQQPATLPTQHAPQGVEPSTTKADQVIDSPRSITGVGWVRLIHNGIDQKENKSGYLFSPGFLEQASIAFSNAREHGRGFSSTDTTLFAGPATRNKLHTACAIAMMLQKHYVDLTASNLHLPRWPHNQRQFHAARYRRGQLHILRAVTGSIVASLRCLLGLDPSWPRDKRLLRLEHILKAGPKEFLIDFRAVLHIGFGTRNAEKIRQRMLLDSAFTLWLCGLCFWTAPDSLSERAALPMRTADWITSVHQSYGDESEIGKRWAKIPASEEGRSLAESCYYIIKAAAAKNPRSIYSDPKADVGRLLWCLRVIREETFMCPDLEGRVGDETDEIMLFLD
ncbi:MAG: hypothetical protein L6R42_004024 [Xanthoria sp. 1 TBL-2021]|nr:MAG: hypothetical protein L6R42_004024 [Xanthoria sp. 1 TBL-2021]